MDGTMTQFSSQWFEIPEFSMIFFELKNQKNIVKWEHHSHSSSVSSNYYHLIYDQNKIRKRERERVKHQSVWCCDAWMVILKDA